ncbi:hypothetical protein ABZY81_03425 [Streptomyces sp. NPDC006514]|uniref:hypothetical protein n=1 Tax=Streptomyces sp. NPDC006514 TaxID=3154308 RepID=UPI0033B96C60
MTFPTGTLIVTTTQAVEIGAFGFAGSLIDNFVGSTDRAVAQINARRAERRDLRGTSSTVRRYTRAWVADISSAAMLVCIVLAGAVGSRLRPAHRGERGGKSTLVVIMVRYRLLVLRWDL